MELERIKYRAKDKFTGRWIYGFPRKTALGNWVIYNGERRYCIVPETLGQYTGLNDKEKAEIFEGDIAKTLFIDPIFGDPIRDVFDTAVIEFHEGAFALHYNNSSRRIYLDNLVVHVTIIGNIFDNTNLLNKEQ